MLKSIEGNFDNPEVHKLLTKHFVELRAASPEGSLAQSDRIATLAWNDYRHFETYYAAACAGYVCHTINPRLFPEQIVYIINHAEDQYVFLDPDFWPEIRI